MLKNLNQTHNFPLNKSVSKQLYSFPKATRFQQTKESLCNRSFYEIKKGAFGQRATTFGYGNKMDMINNQAGAPVGNYQLSGQFRINKERNRGYSFSRDKKNSCSSNPEKVSFLPGPGAYNQKIQKSFDRYATLSYSLGPRLQDTLSRHQNELGPGQYQLIPSITKNGNYFYSKYSNSRCGKIGRAQRKAINDPSITPGPGKYQNQQKTSLNKTGIYFYSKFRNMQASRFGKSNRPPLADTKPVPGPGSYGNFSQFASINKSWVRSSTSGKR